MPTIEQMQQTMQAAIKEAQRLGKLAPVTHGGPGRGRKVAEQQPHSGGNTAVYLCRRLMRDHYYIWRKLKAGKYRSVWAAAKDAGIIT